MSNAPALRALVDPDTQIIDIVDGSGPLLSLTFPEARGLVEQIEALLALWHTKPNEDEIWPRPSR